MKRLFWIREGLRSGGSLLAGGALYGLFMTAISGGGDWRSILLTSGTFLTFFGCFMVMMYNSGAYSGLLSLAASFGCTRREGISGLQLYRLVTLAIPALGCGVALAWSAPGGKYLSIIPPVIAGFLFFSSFGGVLGHCKINKRRVMLTVMITALVAAVVVMALLVAGVWEFTPKTGWILLTVSAALYVFCGVSEVKSVSGS